MLAWWEEKEREWDLGMTTRAYPREKTSKNSTPTRRQNDKISRLSLRETVILLSLSRLDDERLSDVDGRLRVDVLGVFSGQRWLAMIRSHCFGLVVIRHRHCRHLTHYSWLNKTRG